MPSMIVGLLGVALFTAVVLGGKEVYKYLLAIGILLAVICI